MKSMKGSLAALMAMGLMAGAFDPFPSTRGRRISEPEPATEAQRRMFKRPVKLSKRSKAKMKAALKSK